MDSLRNEVGLKCLGCGKVQLPPNRTLDNWSCGNCYSGFISLTMLANLVPRELVAQLTKNRRQAAKVRPCPKCRRALEFTEAVGNGNHATLEICRPCSLIWFDSGALLKLLKQPEKLLTDDEIRRLQAKAPKPKIEATATPTSLFLPISTVGIFLVCLILMIIGNRAPSLISQLGFLPSQPLRAIGLTWITSLFLHDGPQMKSMFALLMIGTYVERRLGPVEYLKLFLIAGLVGRIPHLLSRSDIVVIGSGPAVCGIIGLCLLTLPYREFFVPSQRWRSPANAIVWWTLISFAVLVVYFSWDFFHTAFHQAQFGAVSGGSLPGSMQATLKEGITTASFRAHLAGLFAGAFWMNKPPKGTHFL